MPYVRSMTLAERSSYEATIRQWFPNLELTFEFDTQGGGSEPGDPDTVDPVRARFYKNGAYVEVFVVEQLYVYGEGEGESFYVYGPAQFRSILKDALFQSNETLFPLEMEVPSLSANQSASRARSKVSAMATGVASGRAVRVAPQIKTGKVALHANGCR